MKNKILSTLVSGLIVTVLATTVVMAADAGSSSDPLVTKSYVDTKVNELKAQMVAIENSINGGTNNSNTGTTSDVSNSQYQVVLVPKGAQIIGGEGTEMILRSGTATVVSSTSNGLVNMTTGVDALSGSNVPKNNLMIVPRADGRGFKVTADNTNIMVRGSYEIKY